MKKRRVLKKSIKRKLYKIPLLIMILIFTLTLIYSGIEIYKWWWDNKNTDSKINDIADNTNIIDKEDSDNTSIIGSEEDPNNPYWKYIKMNLMEVDFNNLKKDNSDTVGWIYVGGTNINYPYVQTSDNSYYLKHSFDKSTNEAGWVFLDYRNTLDIDTMDTNTIIYAHSRLDKSMFGSLSNVFKNNWYSNDDNHIIKMSSEKYNSLWQIFSVYHIKTTSDYLQTSFNNDDEYNSFISLIKNRSMNYFSANVTSSDKILTLSTCYSDTEKTVVHAKLIKIESR